MTRRLRRHRLPAPPRPRLQRDGSPGRPECRSRRARAGRLRSPSGLTGTATVTVTGPSRSATKSAYAPLARFAVEEHSQGGRIAAAGMVAFQQTSSCRPSWARCDGASRPGLPRRWPSRRRVRRQPPRFTPLPPASGITAIGLRMPAVPASCRVAPRGSSWFCRSAMPVGITRPSCIWSIGDPSRRAPSAERGASVAADGAGRMPRIANRCGQDLRARLELTDWPTWGSKVPGWSERVEPPKAIPAARQAARPREADPAAGRAGPPVQAAAPRAARPDAPGPGRATAVLAAVPADPA